MATIWSNPGSLEIEACWPQGLTLFIDGQEIPTDINEIGNCMRRGKLITLTPWTIDSILPAPQSEFLIYLKLLMEEHMAALKSLYDYRDHA